MQQAYIMTGSLTDGRTLILDESLPIHGGKVRVVVEVIAPAELSEHAQFMAKLRERQRQRGHVPRSREEIDADLRFERDSWGD